MQPNPIAETSGPLAPSLRLFIALLLVFFHGVFPRFASTTPYTLMRVAAERMPAQANI
jgi:hypothetical protein